MERKMENKNTDQVQNEAIENTDQAAEEKMEEKQDFLRYKLETPVEYGDINIYEIDLRKLRDMTLDDLSEVYDAYTALGGTEGIMQESSLSFVKLLIQRITNYPLDIVGKIGIRDALKLKTRVYRFFYLSK